jgi:hypothetical protein
MQKRVAWKKRRKGRERRWGVWLVINGDELLRDQIVNSFTDSPDFGFEFFLP